MKSSSPRSHLAALKCPVFLFHAKDDTNVPIGESARFAADLKRTNPRVTFVEVPHYAHVWPLWRQNLAEVAQMVFQTKR